MQSPRSNDDERLPSRAAGREVAIHVEVSDEPGSPRFVAEKARSVRRAGRLVFVEGFLRGGSREMQALCRDLAGVARTDIPLLLLGETGVGKDLLARSVHLSSDRARGPYIAVNCAAIPSDLLEVELFGIESGVATGVDKRVGRLELAHGGTLLLDEIGDMPMALQAKLLRALQEHEVRPVGGRPRRIDVRVVSATNANLDDRMHRRQFRTDLFYRLAGLVLHIPPLRERLEDLRGLTEAFLLRHAVAAGKTRLSLTQEAFEAMAGHSWPGNVRELDNEVRRLAYLSPDGAVIRADALSAAVRAPRRSDSLMGSSPAARDSLELAPQVATLEREAIREALRRTAGNRSKAAVLLGISRNTLAEKIRRLEVEPAEELPGRHLQDPLCRRCLADRSLDG